MKKDEFKTIFLKIIRFVLNKTIRLENLKKSIVFVARLANINLLHLAYNNMGILKYWNDTVSGEIFVINHIISKIITDHDLILFDIGANIGDYSKKLREQYPNAEIYAFEPNPYTYKVLKKSINSLRINGYNLGLGSVIEKKKIYTYAKDTESQHASLYKEVLTDIHHSDETIESDLQTTTLDQFCKEKNITIIDFIKIDTEGHEFEILQGAKQLLKNNAIKVIQFEFNEMNIVSRVFLKDFYDFLDNYLIYRLDSHRLIPLFAYSSDNEIFKYQNFLAINKNYTDLVNPN